MEVRTGVRHFGRLVMMAALMPALGSVARGAPLYNAIDLGSGPVQLGTDASGGGTVIGSNGQTYAFNPVQNYLPAQWVNNPNGVPLVSPILSSGQGPNFFSTSTVSFMNSHGLAAGIDHFGFRGSMNGLAPFVVQQQPNGSWRLVTGLGFSAQSPSVPLSSGIVGITGNGQVLAYSIAPAPNSPPGTPLQNELLLYDPIHPTNLVESILTVGMQGGTSGSSPSITLANVDKSLFDEEAQILVQGYVGSATTPDYLLLQPQWMSSGSQGSSTAPQGGSSDPVPAPEPTTLIIFAGLIAGWVVRERRHPRPRS